MFPRAAPAAWLLVLGILPLAGRLSPVAAEEALHLGWDQCGLAGTSNKTFGCLDDVASHSLYCAFSLAQPVTDVIGLEIVVDLQHASPALPSWWDLGVGGCRYGALTASGSAPAGTGCTDFWQGQATGGIQGFKIGQPYGGANQARIKVALAVLSDAPRALNATDLYYAARIVLASNLTTGTSSCAGCSEPACLVLNSILLLRLPGSPGGDVLLETPAPGNGTFATWQGGSGAECAAVPARRTTWGGIKSLYR